MLFFSVLCHMGLGWGGLWLLLHNSMFWGLFLGLQPSGAAARLCVPAEWFQRKILSTVANTQPEWALQYGVDAIATANLRKASIPTIFSLVQYLCPALQIPGKEFTILILQCTAPHLKPKNTASASLDIRPANSRRRSRAPGSWKITAIEEISVHLQIFVLDAAVDPDNLGERKIQTSVPNPHISVLLLNFVQGKGLLLLLIAKRTRQKHLMIKIFVLSYVD